MVVFVAARLKGNRYVHWSAYGLPTPNAQSFTVPDSYCVYHRMLCYRHRLCYHVTYCYLFFYRNRSLPHLIIWYVVVVEGPLHAWALLSIAPRYFVA